MQPSLSLNYTDDLLVVALATILTRINAVSVDEEGYLRV